MTFLNSSNGYSDTSHIRTMIRSIGKGFSGLVNRWVAAMIAQREYQASLAVLHSLNDRQLSDIGINRGQIGIGLTDAARTRTAMTLWMDGGHRANADQLPL